MASEIGLGFGHTIPDHSNNHLDPITPVHPPPHRMADISHLPAECLLRIFDFLDHHKPTLTAASTVCRAWTAPAQSALFRRVDLHSTRQAEAYLAIKDVTRAKRLITRELELDLDRDGVRREALRELLAGQDKLTRLLVQTGLQSVPSAVLRSSDLAGAHTSHHFVHAPD